MNIDAYEISRPLLRCRLRLLIGDKPSTELVCYFVDVARALEAISGDEPADAMDRAFAHLTDLQAGFHDGAPADRVARSVLTAVTASGAEEREGPSREQG